MARSDPTAEVLAQVVAAAYMQFVSMHKLEAQEIHLGLTAMLLFASDAIDESEVQARLSMLCTASELRGGSMEPHEHFGGG